MSTAYSGYFGKVYAGTSGALDMEVAEWSATVKINEIDITTTSDAGYTNTLGGPIEIEGKFKYFYDEAKRPFGTTTSLTPGLVVSPPVLKLYASTGDVLTGPAFIKEVALKSDVKGAIEVEVSFKNKGAWILPT